MHNRGCHASEDIIFMERNARKCQLSIPSSVARSISTKEYIFFRDRQHGTVELFEWKKTDFSWIPEIPSMALQNFHFAVQLVSKSSRTVPPNAQYPAQHPAHCTIFPVNSRSNITLRCISHIKRSRRQKSAAIDDRRFGCFARKLPATNFLFELTRWLSVCVHVYTNQARVPRLPQ